MEAYQANKNKLRSLLQQMEDCPPDQGMTLLDDFIRDYEAGLYHEVGRLARQLHDSLGTVQAEERILDLTEADIPDAKQRLRYVVSLTEQATQNVLSIVEKSVPVSEHIGRRADELQRRVQEAGPQKAELIGDLCGFLDEAKDNSGLLHGHLTEILMAQEYQDITGQIIKKVIDLVEEVEGSLVKMISMTGQRRGAAPRAAAADGPRVPGVDECAERMGGQDDVDQLLVSLGF